MNQTMCSGAQGIMKKCSYCGEKLTIINKHLNEHEKYLKYSMCPRCDCNVLLFLDKATDLMNDMDIRNKKPEDR